MEKFKIGDKAVCVDNIGTDLTLGKTYEVVDTYTSALRIAARNEGGDIRAFYESRFKLAEDTPTLGCSLRAIRDRIYEIDNLLTSLTAERAELVQKLTDEGLALIDQVQPGDVLVSDMTNPDNWQVGDCVKVVGGGSHRFPLNEIVRLRRQCSAAGHWRCEYLDGHDYWWVNSSELEWHSRPSK